MRIEELLELSHYSLVQYRLPSTGELIPLLQIAPSKTDAERLVVVSRCSTHWPDPAQRPRIAEIRDNLIARIAEAEREGWLGETEGLQVSLAGSSPTGLTASRPPAVGLIPGQRRLQRRLARARRHALRPDQPRPGLAS